MKHVDDKRSPIARDAQRFEAQRFDSRRLRIGHCLELLADVLANPAQPADGVIGRFFAGRRYLGSHDRGFIAETVYGTLRNTIRLRWTLGIERMHPRDESALLLAAFLLESDEPPHADIFHDLFGLPERDLGRMRNLLTRVEERIAALPPVEATAVRTSSPTWFAERIIAQRGAADAESLLASLGRQAPITLRANTLRTTRDALAGAMAERGIASQPGGLAPDALLLERRMNANAIPEFKSGWFEMQDEGSQLLSVILDPHPNWNVFDACAGAGGKTLHLAAIMKGRGSVTAHDVNARRLAELRPRLKRSGAQNVRVMPHETYSARRAELAGTCDAVMIDAPCTGAGVFRRNPGAWLTFEEDMVERLVAQQRLILAEYAELVKPGGVLLYATCSLLREENEDQVAAFLASHSGWACEGVRAPVETITPDGFFRSFPHLQGADGFFGAILRRA